MFAFRQTSRIRRFRTDSQGSHSGGNGRTKGNQSFVAFMVMFMLVVPIEEDLAAVFAVFVLFLRWK